MMPDPRFLVSAIVPVYNCAHLLADAIESILAQHHRPIEIIIVDDGSTDDTAAVAKCFSSEVRYIHQPHEGPAAARNKGLTIARGDLIAFLDADDLWAADKLKIQLPHFVEHPLIEIVLGHTQRMVKSESQELKATFTMYRDPVRLFSLGSATFRRSAFEKVGGFDEKMHFAEDDDWFMRADELGIPMHFMEEVTQYYRFHENNMTYDKPARTPFVLKLLKNRLDRFRQINGKTRRDLNTHSAPSGKY